MVSAIKKLFRGSETDAPSTQTADEEQLRKTLLEQAARRERERERARRQEAARRRVEQEKQWNRYFDQRRSNQQSGGRQRAADEEAARKRRAENLRARKARENGETEPEVHKKKQSPPARPDTGLITEPTHFDPSTATEAEKMKYYGKVLELEGRVSAKDIKAQYRRLAAKYHPDKVGHLGEKLRKLAEEETKELNEAYRFFRERFGF